LLGDAFFILYGDSYLDCDYQSVHRVFEESGKLGVMSVFRNENRWDSSNVLFRDGRIVRYDKKHPIRDMQHIDYGLGVLRAAALEGYAAGERVDLAEVYQDLVARDQLAGFEVATRFYEIGSPAGHRRKSVQEFLETVSLRMRLEALARRAGTPVVFAHLVSEDPLHQRASALFGQARRDGWSSRRGRVYPRRWRTARPPPAHRSLSRLRQPVPPGAVRLYRSSMAIGEA
jgi:hypothetical protein